MVDSTIADLTDGVTALATDRIPIARSPYGSGDNRFVTPAYIARDLGREKLTADRDYFVAEAAGIGNDANDGLTITTPFATIQKAINVISNTLDLAIYKTTIKIADGTYIEDITCKPVHGGGPWSTTSPVNILGNVANPQNVIIQAATFSPIVVAGNGYQIDGVRLKVGANAAAFLYIGDCNVFVYFTIRRVQFDATGRTGVFGIQLISGSVFNSATVDILGTGWNRFFYLLNQCSCKFYGTIVIPDSPTFSGGFITADQNSFIECGSTFTITGAVTGKRFLLTRGSQVSTGTSNLNFFPGTIAGTIQGGSSFDNITARRNVIETVARTLTATESEAIFLNTGATAIVPFVLPTAAAGMEFSFYVDDVDGIRVTAAGGDTIRIFGEVSATAGKIESTLRGSAVTLRSVDAVQWVALSALGTWTVT